MSSELRLPALLARSSSLHSAWREVLEQSAQERDDDFDLRESVVLDACSLAIEHGQALRQLLGEGLQTSALALIRVQHEALLRAAWLSFAAKDDQIRTLAAPHTLATLKKANDLPLSGVLLKQVEASNCPPALKKGLREFRDLSWDGANSYTHSGLLPLGRVDTGHPESYLIQMVQVSNAHSYAAHMLAAGILDPAAAPDSLNVVAVAHPGCMLGVS